MKVYKIIAYIYLVFALFFVYDAYRAFSNNEDYFIRLALAAIALFMFIFRLRSMKKLTPNNNK